VNKEQSIKPFYRGVQRKAAHWWKRSSCSDSVGSYTRRLQWHLL